jgi:predicted nucleic acid-binding protein
MAQNQPKIFLGITFLMSFIDRTDYNHLKIVPIMEYLGRYNYKLYTSSTVALQIFMRLEKDFSRQLAQEFLSVMAESSIEILFPTPSDFLAANRYYKMNPDSKARILEVVNAIIMEKNGITEVLTYDSWVNLFGIKKSSLIQ